MKNAQPKTIQLDEYQVPDFLIEKTDLVFDLGEEETRVTSTLLLERNPKAISKRDLVLHGQGLELVSLTIDGSPLGASQYRLDTETLTLFNTPDNFELTCVNIIKPQENTSLEGLYKSSDMFCTQCEAEGFRKITWYLDRPDVMSSFTTTIVANKEKYPVLLSNGNLLDSGESGYGRHWAKWHDPFKKPAYLFALVAGDLDYVQDSFTTMSGKEVDLRIYVESKDLDKCDHAMRSLKNSMAWDEKVYGREYDLDIFMIVAVDDFNMGAMENKGLNIFNTSCVLANKDTTTDLAFQRVEGVVAHEYFHNWSGNRVTCRDWFQLSLKEGFTVFRDQEFSADMGSRTVKRVEDVAMLRTLQFAEDSGPMAHPVQPASFIEISNFYTLTVYEKGAEIVRMLHTLLGAETFRKGSDLYFSRHDGEAVTIDEFLQAMADASGKSLEQFKAWYTQAGTPTLEIVDSYDEQARRYRLTVRQILPDTPEAKGIDKQALHIPVAMGLIGDAGPLPLQLKSGVNPETNDNTHLVLEATQFEQHFEFENVIEKPVPSLLRNFSAPVRLSTNYSRGDYLKLMEKDNDEFCRWDACQQLAVMELHKLIEQHQNGFDFSVDSLLADGLTAILDDPTLDPAIKALMLSMPSEKYLAEIAEVIDVVAIHKARKYLCRQIAENLQPKLWQIYLDNQVTGEYQADAVQIAQRSLKNIALEYLMLLDNKDVHAACLQQYENANNMTDCAFALRLISHCSHDFFVDKKIQLLENFYQKWHKDNLVINQWLSIQASSPKEDVLQDVRSLMQHESFTIKNPNKVRSLIGTFCGNPVSFHQESGEGYVFLVEQIKKLNELNPQVASRLVTPLTRWRKYLPAQQDKMKQALQDLLAVDSLSKDVYEVVSKSL